MLRAWNAPARRRTSPPRRSSGAGYPVWAQRREPRWHGRGPGRHRPGAAPPPEQGQRVGAETPSQAGGQSRASSEPTEPRVWLGLQLSSASWGHDGKTPPPPKPWHYLDAEGKYLLGDVCQEVRGGATLPLVIAGCVVLPARPRTWVGAWPVVCRAPTGHCPLHSPPIPLEGQAFHLRLPPMLQQLPLCPPAAARGGRGVSSLSSPSPGHLCIPREARGCGKTETAVSPGKAAVGYHPLASSQVQHKREALSHPHTLPGLKCSVFPRDFTCSENWSPCCTEGLWALTWALQTA